MIYLYCCTMVVLSLQTLLSGQFFLGSLLTELYKCEKRVLKAGLEPLYSVPYVEILTTMLSLLAELEMFIWWPVYNSNDTRPRCYSLCSLHSPKVQCSA